MKKLRSILSALATLRRVPSAAIASAWNIAADERATTNPQVLEARSLIDSIIDAVVAIAKDDEDKATKPGKSDKP